MVTQRQSHATSAIEETHTRVETRRRDDATVCADDDAGHVTLTASNSEPVTASLQVPQSVATAHIVAMVTTTTSGGANGWMVEGANQEEREGERERGRNHDAHRDTTAPDATVPAARRDSLVVPGYAHRLHRPRVTLKVPAQLTDSVVPHPDDVVVARRDRQTLHATAATAHVMSEERALQRARQCRVHAPSVPTPPPTSPRPRARASRMQGRTVSDCVAGGGSAAVVHGAAAAVADAGRAPPTADAPQPRRAQRRRHCPCRHHQQRGIGAELSQPRCEAASPSTATPRSPPRSQARAARRHLCSTHDAG